MSAPLAQNEEELIGDTVYAGEEEFYQPTNNGPRARFMITLDNDTTHVMYYRPNLPYGFFTHPWGWFTAQPDNHECLTQKEHHDGTGTGVIDTTQTEQHCVRNGPHTVRLWRVTWDANGQYHTQRDTLFVRRVAMLGTRGTFDTEPLSSTWYHDVHLTFDLTPDVIGVAGDLRAGLYYVFAADTAVYAERDTFTIGEQDSLWFQSTFVATGAGGRPWYNSTKAVVTGFNFDFNQDPERFSGGVNSRPGPGETSAALWLFPARGLQYRVVGRVVAPTHHEMSDGLDQTDSSLYVTSLPLDACFGVTGFRVTGQPLTFDGHCSTGADTLEYRWTFGDGDAVDWSRDSVVVHHTYTAAGSFPATLRVRGAGTTGPVDSTTQTIAVAGPLWVGVSGPDYISASGTYSWTSQPHDGAPPTGRTGGTTRRKAPEKSSSGSRRRTSGT